MTSSPHPIPLISHFSVGKVVHMFWTKNCVSPILPEHGLMGVGYIDTDWKVSASDLNMVPISLPDNEKSEVKHLSTNRSSISGSWIFDWSLDFAEGAQEASRSPGSSRRHLAHESSPFSNQIKNFLRRIILLWVFEGPSRIAWYLLSSMLTRSRQHAAPLSQAPSYDIVRTPTHKSVWEIFVSISSNCRHSQTVVQLRIGGRVQGITIGRHWPCLHFSLLWFHMPFWNKIPIVGNGGTPENDWAYYTWYRFFFFILGTGNIFASKQVHINYYWLKIDDANSGEISFPYLFTKIRKYMMSAQS